ncbi:MAG: PepSY-like domain-containing protein [Bacteroidota bacterium]|nr:PepSY-like domain-containing protein [Bacteroidota bacterium]
MKRIAKGFMVAMCLFLGATAMGQNTSELVTIEKNNLPKESIGFIDKYFSDKQIEYILLEKNTFSSDEYKVKLSDNVEIEFDQKGNWKEVEVLSGKMPNGFINKNILNYVNSKFPNTEILKIDKSKSGKQEVKISNGLELEFDAKGNFLRIED